MYSVSPEMSERREYLVTISSTGMCQVNAYRGLITNISYLRRHPVDYFFRFYFCKVSVPEKRMGALDAHRVFTSGTGRMVSKPNK